MDGLSDQVREALMARRDGDIERALAVALSALKQKPEDVAIVGLTGMLLCELGRPVEGIAYLRSALARQPADIGTRANLTMALLATGSLNDALEVSTVEAAEADASMRLWRLRALALQQAGRNDEAVEGYLRVVSKVRGDFESWNNLGNLQRASGDQEGALRALRYAATLRPDLIEVGLNLAAALGDARQTDEAIAVLRRYALSHPADPRPMQALGYWLSFADRDVEALEALSRAAELAPDEIDIWVAIGMTQMKLVEPGPAEEALRRAIALRRDHPQANIQLSILLEGNNRTDDLAALVGQARECGVEHAALDFMEVLLLRRQKRHAEALERLKAIPSEIEPVRVAHMRGEMADRLGNAPAAFAAFMEMNRLAAEDPSDPLSRAMRYRDEVRLAIRRTSPQWVSSWRPALPNMARQAPIFLVGFPRSGTTLLDTLLLGHPDVRVLEERSPLRIAQEAMGHFERIAALGEIDINALRSRYFEEVDNILPRDDNKIIIDKFPLHMNKMAFIKRIFPESKIIFVERHPCDVVLSCFITNFNLNYAMANFLDLRDVANLYDLSFTCWEGARASLELNVHTVRYERVLADREAELRQTIGFMGLSWSPAVLDHETTAYGRGNVRTASYAQVTEPLYHRAEGRWTRYREYLEPVLPTLAPWAAKMGYTL